MSIYDKVADEALSVVRDSFFTVGGLLAAYLLTFLLLLPVHYVIKNDFDYEWSLYAMIYLILGVGWLIWRYRYPRNNGKQTGIVIALHARDRGAVILKNKFANELRKNIADASLGDVFNVILLKNHLSEKIRDKNDIERANTKIMAHLYLFGDICKERDGDGYSYFIKLEGYVVHDLVPVAVSRELSVDFRSLLPKETDFSELFGYRCIRMTGKIAYLAARYVVGVAALLSNSPFLAFRLHKDTEKEFSQYDLIQSEMSGKGRIQKLDSKYLNQLREKLVKLISNEAMIIAGFYLEKNEIDKCIEYLRVGEEYNPCNYGVLLLRAMVIFLHEHNVDAAVACVMRAKQYAESKHEWRYSLAFLLFWRGDFDRAYKECQKIAQCSYEKENETINYVERFNLKILDSRNDKPQLYFWIGYIVLKKRGDPVLASRYFQAFLETSAGRIPFLEQKARSFLNSRI